MPYDLSPLRSHLGQAAAGIVEMPISGVRLFWTTQSTPPAPLVYEAGIVLLLQGRKEGSIGEHHFVYDTDNYLTLTLPMPFLCAHHASPDAPLCGLFITALRDDLSQLLGRITASENVQAKTGHSALAPAPVCNGMRLAVGRLVATINDPVAAAVLGPALRREILFHVLRGPRGPALAAYALQSGDDGRLDRLIETICRDFSAVVSVQAMAGEAGMSLSAFHRAFRTRTGQSPLQYVKRLRLHAARDMILFEGTRVGDAARRVGYESTSQFSREYRRHFGEPATATRTFAVRA
ncbi:AraC family transcriptional regulator [Azospirillum brasilense]|nr:AraC family transcriptional regulator [Azospirillum brasilense]